MDGVALLDYPMVSCVVAYDPQTGGTRTGTIALQDRGKDEDPTCERKCPMRESGSPQKTLPGGRGYEDIHPYPTGRFGVL